METAGTGLDMAPKDDEAFGPKTLKLMTRAVDTAKRRLRVGASIEEHEALAKRVLDAVKAGERKISRLVESALSGLRRGR
jgi:hypothetical protein